MLLCAGWVGGIITLLLFYGITLWASLLLTECHETGGMKHPTYRSAVLHILGECWLPCIWLWHSCDRLDLGSMTANTRVSSSPCLQ